MQRLDGKPSLNQFSLGCPEATAAFVPKQDQPKLTVISVGERSHASKILCRPEAETCLEVAHALNGTFASRWPGRIGADH